jgi:hypothetical protein
MEFAEQFTSCAAALDDRGMMVSTFEVQFRCQVREVLALSNLSGVRDGSVVVRFCHTRSRAQVRILGRLMVLFIQDSHLSEIRIMSVTTERKDGGG